MRPVLHFFPFINHTMCCRRVISSVWNSSDSSALSYNSFQHLEIRAVSRARLCWPGLTSAMEKGISSSIELQWGRGWEAAMWKQSSDGGEGSEFPLMLYHLITLKRAVVVVAIVILCCDRLLSDYDFGPSQWSAFHSHGPSISCGFWN